MPSENRQRLYRLTFHRTRRKLEKKQKFKQCWFRSNRNPTCDLKIFTRHERGGTDDLFNRSTWHILAAFNPVVRIACRTPPRDFSTRDSIIFALQSGFNSNPRHAVARIHPRERTPFKIASPTLAGSTLSCQEKMKIIASSKVLFRFHPIR